MERIYAQQIGPIDYHAYAFNYRMTLHATSTILVIVDTIAAPALYIVGR